MEDHMSRLFDLIASKSFEELAEEERTFVLTQLTEAEYRMQQTILSATEELSFEEAEPLPLVLPKQKKPVRTIPLYQAVIGAAACLAIGFFIFPGGKGRPIDFQFFEHPVEITLANVPNEVQIIHDTIREKLYVNSPAKMIRDTLTVVQTVFVSVNETRMLEASNSLNPIPLDRNLLQPKTLSAKEDGSVKLLPDLNDYSSMK